MLHNVVHLGTGLLALYIGFGMSGRNLVNGVIGFGILYVVIFVAVLVSPTLFGLFSVPANAYLHVIHAALAVVSLAVGYMARGAVGSQLAAPEPEPPTPPPPQPMQAALSRLRAVWWRFRRLTHSCMS